ncbi:hypothetical protein LV79_002752 [Actinokineospora globicatena]|nr:hypothetical protein [Actinokineospora globicatena]GLW79841.1 hypothetical protein Aglo01_43220 [Actinokineospora globicatena]GLW85749.1 hypothetical protein Aglo02_33890 [Actinokineospora globicatena]
MAVGIGVALLVGAVVLVSLPDSPEVGTVPRTPPEPGLAARVHDFATALRENAPYRPPGDAQREALTGALAQLGRGAGGADAASEVAETREALTPLGFSVDVGVDTRTGRSYAVVASEPNAERGWGLYVVDLSAPTRYAIQVPHPANDLGTDALGVELFRRLPGAVLSVSGTHRRVANGAGDVAHREDSMFSAVAEAHSRAKVPQVQLHGFDDASFPSADVVLSPGATDSLWPASAIADGVDGTGSSGNSREKTGGPELDVCRAWERACGDLEGRRNVQGIAAAREGAPFAHIEVNRTTRDDPERWGELVRVIENTLRER